MLSSGNVLAYGSLWNHIFIHLLHILLPLVLSKCWPLACLTRKENVRCLYFYLDFFDIDQVMLLFVHYQFKSRRVYLLFINICSRIVSKVSFHSLFEEIYSLCNTEECEQFINEVNDNNNAFHIQPKNKSDTSFN